MAKKRDREKLEKLNREEFSIQMKDRWSDEDFDRMSEIKAEQRKLEKLLDQDEN